MFNPEGAPKSPVEKPQLLEDKQWRNEDAESSHEEELSGENVAWWQ